MPTGDANGFDVLDVDPAGRAWFELNFDALPATRAHQTPRGLHILFKHRAGLRGSVGKIAQGIDVRAEGGYVIWWPREGYAVEHAPLSEWPGWLLEEARGRERGRAGRTQGVRGPHDGEGGAVVAGVAAALMQLDPRDFVGERARWLALMNGARAAGVALEVFCEWTSGQEHYARNDDEVAQNWASLRAEHPGAFHAELSRAGIRLRHGGGGAATPRVRPTHSLHPTHRHSPLSLPTTLNLHARTQSARGPLQRARGAAREPALFGAACVLAEIVAEKRMKLAVATALLESDCQGNGLWKEKPDLCRRAIGRAFRHVELKILGEQE